MIGVHAWGMEERRRVGTVKLQQPRFLLSEVFNLLMQLAVVCA